MALSLRIVFVPAYVFKEDSVKGRPSAYLQDQQDEEVEVGCSFKLLE